MYRYSPVEPSGFGVRVPGGVRSPRSGPVYPDRALTSGTRYGRQTLGLATVTLIIGTLLACIGTPRRRSETGSAPTPLEPTDAAPTTSTDQPPPAKVISFEDDDDRAYRRFVEAHRPGATP